MLLPFLKFNQMTQVCAIAFSYLKGESNSIMTAFQKFYCTNLPRENGRSIERKFGIKLQKVVVNFKSTYGRPGQYFRYTLLKTRENKEGRQRMIEYCKKQLSNPKTQLELKASRQLSIL